MYSVCGSMEQNAKTAGRHDWAPATAVISSYGRPTGCDRGVVFVTHSGLLSNTTNRPPGSLRGRFHVATL